MSGYFSDFSEMRALCAIALIGLCSLFFVACGCNDVGCTALTIRVADRLVEPGETLQLTADGEPLACDDAEDNRCTTHAQNSDTLMRIDARPKKIEVRAVNAEGETRTLWTGEPAYKDRQNKDACGDCDHSASVTVE